jgi:hypothetical protein
MEPRARLRWAVDPLRTVGSPTASPRPVAVGDEDEDEAEEPGACHTPVGSERSGGGNGSGSCISRFSRDGKNVVAAIPLQHAGREGDTLRKENPVASIPPKTIGDSNPRCQSTCTPSPPLEGSSQSGTISLPHTAIVIRLNEPNDRDLKGSCPLETGARPGKPCTGSFPTSGRGERPPF